MRAGESTLGGTALLRVAGLPIQYWLAAASPKLFALLELLDKDEAVLLAEARLLAERIGERLVPNPDLSHDHRVFLLDLRRRLHRGERVASSDTERLLAIQSELGRDEDFLPLLADQVLRKRELVLGWQRLDDALGAEEERLLDLPSSIRNQSPIGRAVLPDPEDVPGQVGRISPKVRRHRSEYLWRLLARSTQSTPRGWFSHVALLPVDDSVAIVPPSLDARYATEWTQNVRTVRRALADPPLEWPFAGTRLALNPLHWSDNEHLTSLVLDHDDSEQAVVRRTPLLEAVSATLHDGARSFDDIATTLGCRAGEEWLTLRGFLRHLVVLGVLQAGTAPATSLERRVTPTGRTHAMRSLDPESGWVDVYRSVDGSLPSSFAAALQGSVVQALRVLSLQEPDQGNQGSSLGKDRSWSFPEILAAELGGRQQATPQSGQGEHSSERLPSTRLSDLLRDAASHVEPGATIVLSEAQLDAAGADPPGPLPWPVDCLVRVAATGAGYAAVLEQIWPAGMLDSRFADALTDLHGVVQHVEAYREFLQRLEELTGILMVEILAPPLADGAANAVRRPTYTRAWTGDPHSQAYMRCDPGRYVPLSAIRISRVGGRLLADVDGQPIWPVYHATRSFSPPWDRVAQILLSTSPPNVPLAARTMLRSLDVPTGMAALPRISVGGGLVLAPAQWLLSPAELWDRTTSNREKVRALVRLRRQRSLPRWAWLVPAGDGPLVPCDFESLQAIRMLERGATSTSTLRLVEMLPGPGDLWVIDKSHSGAHTVSSQIQLRLPSDETPAAAAARVAVSMVASLSAEPRARESASLASRCRDPPAPQRRRRANSLDQARRETDQTPYKGRR